MKLRALSTVGVGAVGLTLVSAASPAVAAPDCGPVPAGATLTVLPGNTCQLDFAAAGSFNWTVPAGAQGLQALVLGAGSGAFYDPTDLGYAGNAGLVRYIDYSATAPGAPATIIVGAGGSTGDLVTSPTAGLDSSVTMSAVQTAADGGGAVITTYCAPEGSFSVLAGNGQGAGGTPAVADDCELSYAPGITPSVDAVDSYANPRPAIFADLATSYGLGGRVLITGDTLPADSALNGLGVGANVLYDGTDVEIVSANAVGGSGRVILRYTTTAVAGALAATGVEAAPVLTIAALTAGLGAALLAMSRRRKTA